MNPSHSNLFGNKSFVFLFLFILSACAWQDTGIEPITFGDDSPDMLTFSSYEEFLSQSNDLFAKTQEEIAMLEVQKGFKSFGRMADEAYNRALEQNFSSIEEIEKFVEKNNQFLEISVGEDGEKSLERTIPDKRFSYFINSERLFKAGDLVYKVFKDKIVSAQAVDIEKLRNLSESDKITDVLDGLNVHDLRQQVSAVYPVYCPNNDNCPDWKIAENGNERVKLKLCVQSNSYTNNMFPQPKFYNIGSYLEAKAQKKTFIWFDAKRTITAKYKAMVDYNFGSGWERACFDQTFQTNGPQWSINLSWFVISDVNTPNAPSFHFSGKDSWASIPGSTMATFTCNAPSICLAQ